MKQAYLRSAVPSDVDLLFKWANDPVVRRNSFNSETISYMTHVEWFHRMMENKSVLQYILMDEEAPVGQIRLTVENEVAEIGYSIASEYRGKGYGHIIIQLIVDIVKRDHPEIKRLIAKVKPDNTASNKLFQSEGYKIDCIRYSLLIYR